MSNEKREQQMMDAADRYADEVCDESCTGAQVADTINDFCAGWRAADSHPQWIPVEEELPKFDEQVLVYGLCPNGCRLFYVDCLIQDINNNGYPKWDDDTIIPTHWKPIVPPRKEDKK